MDHRGETVSNKMRKIHYVPIFAGNIYYCTRTWKSVNSKIRYQIAQFWDLMGEIKRVVDKRSSEPNSNKNQLLT